LGFSAGLAAACALGFASGFLAGFAAAFGFAGASAFFFAGAAAGVSLADAGVKVRVRAVAPRG
jgi:hypothetical protein